MSSQKFLLSLALAGLSGVALADWKIYNFTDFVGTGREAVKSATGAVSLTDGKATLTKDRVYTVDNATVYTGNDKTLFGAAAGGAASGGSWSETAPYVAPTVTDGKFVFSGTKSQFKAASSGNVVRVDSRMEFSGGADELDSTLEAYGSFTLAQDDNGDYSWKGLTGSGWVTLTGVTAETGTFDTRLEFDFASGKVRYLIKATSADAYTVLKYGDTEWFAMKKTSGSAVASVSYEGTGNLTSFSTLGLDTAVAEVDGVKKDSMAAAMTAGTGITLLTDVSVTPAATGTWNLSGGYDCAVNDVVGYTSTLSDGVLTISQYQTVVKTAVTGAYGYDYTNATLTVNFAGSEIQAGDTSVTAQITVKDANGTVVGSSDAINVLATTENITFAVPKEVTPEKGNTYELVIKKGSETIAQSTSIFVPGEEGSWFDARSGRWTTDGAWTGVTPAGEKIALSDTACVFTPKAPTATDNLVVVDTVVEVTGALAFDDLPTVGAGEKVQGMITVAETAADDSTPTWKAYAGNSWVNLTGASTEAGTYTIRAEFDYAGETKLVRYSVGKDGVFSVLKNGDVQWLANGDNEATTLASTAALGSGNLVSLVGKHYDAFVAEVNGVKYKTAEAAIAASENGKHPIVYTHDCTIPGAKSEDITYNDHPLKVVVDEAFKAANGNLTAVGENGLKKIESYVLGLDPADATSKPVVSTVQGTEPGQITMQIANVRTDSGLPVKFQLETSTTTDFESSTTGEEQGEPAFTITLDGKIKYYKINYSFE